MDSLEFFRTRGEEQLKGGDDGPNSICILQDVGELTDCLWKLYEPNKLAGLELLLVLLFIALSA